MAARAGNPSPVVIVAATSLERKALRRALPDARIVLAGVGLANLREDLGDTVLSCGLAGGLRKDLPTGTLLLPRKVRRPGGGTLQCDEALVEALALGARTLGVEPVFDPLLTAESIVNGAARAYWARQGYAGVDMETGRLTAPRVAAVRVDSRHAGKRDLRRLGGAVARAAQAVELAAGTLACARSAARRRAGRCRRRGLATSCAGCLVGSAG